MDNICVINYIVNIQLEIGKKAMALFVDLRAAFDSMESSVQSNERRADKGGIDREGQRSVKRNKERERREDRKEFLDREGDKRGVRYST